MEECLRLWVLLYAAPLQSGRMSELQKICDVETWYHPRKNPVLFILRMFLSGANVASWLSGPRTCPLIEGWWVRTYLRHTLSFFSFGEA